MEKWTEKPCKQCGAVFKRQRRVQQFCSQFCYIDSKVEKPTDHNGCWIWRGPINSHGYGVATENYRSIAAHRMSYEAYHGPLGELFALHHCDNPPCVNPQHLFAGTQADNMRDRDSKGRGRFVIPRLRGSAAPKSKVTEHDVIAIRTRHAAGASIASIARDYPITSDAVWRIVHRRNWKHI